MQMRLNAAARFRNVGRCESQQPGFGSGMAGGAGDIGHGQLARVRVGMANGGGQCHGRVRLEASSITRGSMLWLPRVMSYFWRPVM